MVQYCLSVLNLLCFSLIFEIFLDRIYLNPLKWRTHIKLQEGGTMRHIEITIVYNHLSCVRVKKFH